MKGKTMAAKKQKGKTMAAKKQKGKTMAAKKQKGKTMAAKKQKGNTVYRVKVPDDYLLFDGEMYVGCAGSRVTAVDEAKRLGYDGVEEVSFEKWLEIILLSE